MRFRISGGYVASALALALVLGAARSPAQVFDFDNVVMLANRDPYPGYNDVWGFVGSNGREYVIQGTITGTAWWDIDDPVHPVLVKFIGGPSSVWRDMAVKGSYAYVGTEGGGGIQIVDIGDPANPTLVNTYTATVSNCHNLKAHPTRPLLCVVGGYSTMANGGMQILDLSDPVNPVEVGRWDNRYIHDISFEGDIVHACLINDGRYRMIDISDSTNPVNYGAGFLDPTGSVHASWPVGDGIHTVIAEETTGGHVKIIDRSNPSAPVAVGEFNPNPAASVHNVHVQGSLCWASWYAYGTRVIDVSDPTDPVEVGHWDTYPGTNGGGVGPGNWGVYPHLPSGVVAANDREYGLFLLRYQPDAGKLAGAVSSSVDGPLAGATVRYDNLDITQETGAGGAYAFSVFPGAGHTVHVSAFGHAPDSATVAVAPDGTVVTDFVLTKYPAGDVAGRVTDAASGLPIPAVEIALAGTPLTVITDANGEYAFTGVPTLPSASYALHVSRYGYALPPDLPVTVVANEVVTRDLALEPAAVYEDFASAPGWTVSNDASTTSGFWTFAEPFGTYSSGIPVQTETDHTLDPENVCAVTGNLASGGTGDDDVDGGATRLLSPVFDLSAMASPHAFYYRWYTVSAEQDAWQVHASPDGGATWIPIESSVSNEAYWKAVDVDLSAVLSSFTEVRFRFTAEDAAPGQIVEAALDDFTLYDAGGGATDVAPSGAGPRILELAQNFPNPFPGATSFEFALPERGAVQLSIFDVRGARVATIVEGELEAGRHRATWDGRTPGGKKAAAGVYFCQLRAGDGIRTRKLVRVE